MTASPNVSFWRDSLERPTLEPSLEGRERADVVLAGGGYTSLVAAYWLKRRQPALDVALLEREYVGFGASGRNAGMVLHELPLGELARHGERAVRFTYRQASAVPDFIGQIATEAGFDCDLERTGYFQIGFCEAHTRHLAAVQARYRALGVDLPLLDRAAIQDAIHSRRFQSALLFPQAAMLHPGKYVAGLHQAVRHAGVKIYERSPITRVVDGPSLEARTPRGCIRADRLVLGLNAYLQAARLGVVRNRAVSVSSFIILTEPLDEGAWRALHWEGRQGYSDERRLHNYVRPVGRRVLFGGRVVYHFGVGSPARTEGIFSSLRDELLRTFPSLRDVAITHRWAGPVALTPRRIPTIGRAGRAGNIYYALGYSGMGVALATLAGRVIADLLTGGEDQWRDLVFLRDQPWPLPPEPLTFLGFKGRYYAMRLMDAIERWR